MELYNRVIELIDANLISCLGPIILTLILIEFFFKSRFETKKTLNLIRWTIIIYTLVTWIYSLIEMNNTNNSVFINRMAGPYAWAYWMMIISSLILPFTLLVKKLASNFWYVLFISFAMKIGMSFERFVIIITSFHRDYLPGSSSAGLGNVNTELIKLFSFGIGIMFLQGLTITILTLGILELIKRKKLIH